MNTLVTGGAGFIGGYLVRRLLDEGLNVIVLDTYSPDKKTYLEKYKKKKSLTVIWTDITEKNQVKQSYFRDIDWVFHLAGKGNITPSLVNPLAFHRIHVDGTAHILEASRKAKVKRFLYAGSASCYGMPDIFPTPETASIRTDHPYALTKYVGEQYALHWGKVYKLPVISLRLFNVYGPRSRSEGTHGPVLSAFLAQKLAGKPFTVVGDGTQKRDFVFVTDVVEAFFLAAQSSVFNEVLNVGSGQPHSINELVKRLKGEVAYIPKRPGEPEMTYADITKIRTLLRWKPNVSFTLGVKHAVGHIDYWKDAPVWTPDLIRKETRLWFEYLGKKKN